ncbi:retrovirus-related pol polyprotein from transposon TNT 1-94 [Tanacetum coccineum]|uniref:Retrovirus-related pol polyprotein from transposon TNT 1-94 n=1 Tax=Tanacetum coccineum TaxID=301880 RepID=A0ABQ5I180_9ASTR
MVSNFMESQDVRLSKFEADFKRKQGEMTNKIDTMLKAITDRLAGALPSDTIKNLKLGTHPVLSARFYPTMEPQCSSHPSTLINAIKVHSISQTSLQQPEVEIKPQQPEEPEPTLEDEFQDLHLNLSVLEVLAHTLIYNAILDKYVDRLEIGKNGSTFFQGDVPKKMEDPGLFTLPCRIGDSKPFDTLADLGSCLNLIPLYLLKKLNIGLLEETNHIFGLADGTKSYPVRIVKDVEVHIRKLKLLNDFYVIDMKKDPETPLLVGKGFLAIANTVIDYRMAKITVGEGITSEQIPNQKKKILGIDQLTENTFSSVAKDLIFLKSSADNSYVSITVSDKSKLSKAEDSTLSNHSAESQKNTTDPSITKLDGAEPISEPKTIKSILISKPTSKVETLKGIIITEPSSAPARSNKSSSNSKSNSAPAGKLKNVKIEDDPPLAIVMKELNELKLQLSKNKSSYFINRNTQQVPLNTLQNKYKTQFKINCELYGENSHLSENCYQVLFCKKCKRTDHRTCDHTEFMSSMNINQYHNGQGESSSRSRPLRPTMPFLFYIHCGYNDHKSDDCAYYPICEIWGSYDHDTHSHNRIISLRRGIKPRNPQHIIKNCETCGSNVHTTSDHNDIEWFRKRGAPQAKKAESFKANKSESLSAIRLKTPTKRKPFDEGAVSEWFAKECIGTIATWENLVEKFVQKFYHHSEKNEEVDAEKDDDPDEMDNVPEICKIKGNLFDFETPLCKAFKEFKYLLKIDTDLFTYDIQEFKTYDKYEQELNKDMARGLNEQWSDNGVPYQLCDHICEPYRFKNIITKWPTCSSDINGFCNGGELLRMGDATPGVMKFCTWLKNSFGDFHELGYDVLVKLEECWWKVNAHEIASFARWENYSQGPYANKTEKAYDPYLDINRIFRRNYGTINAGDTRDSQEPRETNPTYDLVCRIRRFEMMKYSFDTNDEYVAIKEHEHHSRTNVDSYQAYRELFCIMSKGWLVTVARDE